jgi:hypothetical protein
VGTPRSIMSMVAGQILEPTYHEWKKCHYVHVFPHVEHVNRVLEKHLRNYCHYCLGKGTDYSMRLQTSTESPRVFWHS